MCFTTRRPILMCTIFLICSTAVLFQLSEYMFCPIGDALLYLTLFRAVFSLPGHSLPMLYTDLCLLRLWSRAFFFVLRTLRKCSCHSRDSPSMLDPPPMIEFLKLRACLVRIKGRHALKWGTCSNSNTEQQYSIQWQDREQALVSS